MYGMHKFVMLRLAGADPFRSMYNGGGKDGPEAPDYGPMAQASKESAEIMAGLGREQLSEARRQYDLNRSTIDPIISRQKDIMDQTYQQGADYANYGRSIRPAERAMLAESFGLSAADLSGYQNRLNAAADARSREEFGRKQAEALRSDQELAYQRSQSDREALNTQRSALAAQYTAQLQAAQVGGQDTSAITNNYQTQLAAIDAKLGGLAQSPTGGLTKASPYKLAGNQIIDREGTNIDHFYSGGKGYTVDTRGDGFVSLVNAAGNIVGQIDPSGRVLSSKDNAATNAYLQTRNQGTQIGGRVGSFNKDRANEYFSGGQSYYMDEATDGSVKMYNSAGKVVASYGPNSKGQVLFTGNAKLMQQAMSDRRYKDPDTTAKAQTGGAADGKSFQVGNGSYTVDQTTGGTRILDASGKVVATIDANGQVAGDTNIAAAIKPELQTYAGTDESERLLREADDFAATAYMNAAAQKKAQEQSLIDGQAAQDASDRANITGLMSAGNNEIYNRDANNIETDVGRAVADSRSGYANSMNQALRQGMRYGYSPARLAAMGSSAALGNAQMQAQAANATRTQGIDAARQRLIGSAQTGMGLRQQDFARNKGYTTQDQSINWAKRLDSIGMGKGMPGASQGAYGLAVSSGNSAAGNQMQPGNALMNGMVQGSATIGQGRQMYQQGLGSILNAQTSFANANQGGDDGLGGLLGAASNLGAAWLMKPN